ncbi:GntR family transcriptional regulator [Streptomyces sp. NPDC058953]|uniref:GntR family transcriptional regulator n=1 Tax=unclassified Streptomyces TaxID=2593676 RepID=UPI0036A18A9D
MASGRRPKYQLIADVLREAIRAGVYGPGDRLPGENDLMAEHGVARMTARQALGVLQAEGLTETRKGAGVFVRAFRPVRRRSVGRVARSEWGEGRSIWGGDAQDRQLVVDDIVVREEPAPERIAGVLGIGVGDPVCVRTRRYVLDGKPVMLATSYLPGELVAGSPVAWPDPGPGGIYARLAELGQAPARFREEVRSRMPSQEEARRLGLGSGTPVVLVCRTAYTARGRAVEVNEMTLDAAAYILEYDFEA